MFGTRQGSGNGHNPSPPPQIQQHDIPPLRTFLVRRMQPVPSKARYDVVEEITIEAHEVESGASGSIRFLEGVYDPAVSAVRGRIKRAFASYLDYEEVFEPTLPDSGIILPPSGLTM